MSQDDSGYDTSSADSGAGGGGFDLSSTISGVASFLSQAAPVVSAGLGVANQVNAMAHGQSAAPARSTAGASVYKKGGTPSPLQPVGTYKPQPGAGKPVIAHTATANWQSAPPPSAIPAAQVLKPGVVRPAAPLPPGASPAQVAGALSSVAPGTTTTSLASVAPSSGGLDGMASSIPGVSTVAGLLKVSATTAAAGMMGAGLLAWKLLR